ncbi:hypothetical protein EYF80_060979 [Liparis tanakae]|uniref:Uncharacterized protein n=1 Tax=Liparis tanakae TaxID=230148 RepID=A0A4Z2EKJ7_9TELE|nr:hypothetical protein EYF80_060979 [Liparis tanakae]
MLLQSLTTPPGHINAAAEPHNTTRTHQCCCRASPHHQDTSMLLQSLTTPPGHINAAAEPHHTTRTRQCCCRASSHHQDTSMLLQSLITPPGHTWRRETLNAANECFASLKVINSKSVEC